MSPTAADADARACFRSCSERISCAGHTGTVGSKCGICTIRWAFLHSREYIVQLNSENGFFLHLPFIVTKWLVCCDQDGCARRLSTSTQGKMREAVKELYRYCFKFLGTSNIINS